MEYNQYTQEDAAKNGIGFTVSRYSMKLVDGDEMIGAIIFENERLKLSEDFIKLTGDIEARSYYEALKCSNSIYLRKIIFSEEQQYSGKLEDLFDYTVNQLPLDHLIWCIPSLCGEKYIQQLGGFVNPRYPLPNTSIRFFALNV